MKKNKNCNNLYILAFLAILFIIIISITMNMKESYTTRRPNSLDDFNPNIIQQNVDVSTKKNMDIAVMQLDNFNFNITDKYNNSYEISYDKDISYESCFNKCIQRDNCIGIVTNFREINGTNTGSCSLRSNMDMRNKKTDKNYFSTILPR